MRALSYPEMIHGAIEHSISYSEHRNLWRIDKLNGYYNLLILSEKLPDLQSIHDQFGIEDRLPESRDYDKLLQNIEDNQVFRFRLKANPVKSSAVDSNGGRGKIYAHVSTEQIAKWLLDRSSSNGFFLDRNGFKVMDCRWYRFMKSSRDNTARNNVTIKTATFEGILKVSNSKLFMEALMNGIGRGKAYGCGLMTIMKK